MGEDAWDEWSLRVAWLAGIILAWAAVRSATGETVLAFGAVILGMLACIGWTAGRTTD